MSTHRPKSPHSTAPISHRVYGPIYIYVGVTMQFGWDILLCYVVIFLFIVCPCVFHIKLSWLYFILVVAVDL